MDMDLFWVAFGLVSIIGLAIAHKADRLQRELRELKDKERSTNGGLRLE